MNTLKSIAIIMALFTQLVISASASAKEGNLTPVPPPVFLPSPGVQSHAYEQSLMDIYSYYQIEVEDVIEKWSGGDISSQSPKDYYDLYLDQTKSAFIWFSGRLSPNCYPGTAKEHGCTPIYSQAEAEQVWRNKYLELIKNHVEFDNGDEYNVYKVISDSYDISNKDAYNKDTSSDNSELSEYINFDRDMTRLSYEGYNLSLGKPDLEQAAIHLDLNGAYVQYLRPENRKFIELGWSGKGVNILTAEGILTTGTGGGNHAVAMRKIVTSNAPGANLIIPPQNYFSFEIEAALEVGAELILQADIYTSSVNFTVANSGYTGEEIAMLEKVSNGDYSTWPTVYQSAGNTAKPMVLTDYHIAFAKEYHEIGGGYIFVQALLTEDYEQLSVASSLCTEELKHQCIVALTPTLSGGTSGSSAYMGATAALVKQKFPSLTNKDVSSILLQTATDMGIEGPDATYGMGRVNLPKAMDPIGNLY